MFPCLLICAQSLHAHALIYYGQGNLGCSCTVYIYHFLVFCWRISLNVTSLQGCEREVADAEKGSSDKLRSECIMRLSWALVHSKRPEDVQRGIAMLEGYIEKGFFFYWFSLICVSESIFLLEHKISLEYSSFFHQYLALTLLLMWCLMVTVVYLLPLSLLIVWNSSPKFWLLKLVACSFSSWL